MGIVEGQSYRVYFTDKGDQAHLLENPLQILSAEALSRRAAMGIPLDESDLPVSKFYLNTIQSLGGSIAAHSRWLNYAYVNGLSADELLALPFVKKVEQPKKHVSHLASTSSTTFDYGLGTTQIEMLNGHKLHQQGFTGRGVTIAVIDAGFMGSLQSRVLDSLFASGRLMGSHNFITGDTNVYTGQGAHGASVLSVMAALDSGVFVGTAPHANYWLLTSENVHSETPVEMDHWLMAAEFADSVGARVINTSLGYTTFDDPTESYAYSDMDGNTTVVTKAADWAASKGIIVVASAGNEGGGSWQYIGAPADGDSVLAVGAVDGTGAYVGFSSRGPSYDWRIKPDVAAMGAGTTLINAVGDLSAGNGTSFSSPLIAGMAACVVQGQPTLHGQTIADNIRHSGHLYGNANTNLGFGIPDFLNAWQIGVQELETANTKIQVYPNPSSDKVNLQATIEFGTPVKLALYNQVGQCVLSKELIWDNSIQSISVADLESGIYILSLSGDQQFRTKIWVK